MLVSWKTAFVGKLGPDPGRKLMSANAPLPCHVGTDCGLAKVRRERRGYVLLPNTLDQLVGPVRAHFFF